MREEIDWKTSGHKHGIAPTVADSEYSHCQSDVPDDYDDFDEEFDEEFEALPRDPKIDEAKEVLLSELFKNRPDDVFYSRQIQILVESEKAMKDLTGERQPGFYHWITDKAVRELAAEGLVKTKAMPLGKHRPSPTETKGGGTQSRFFWSPKNRYWKRKANTILKLVRAFAAYELARAIGEQGETMFDAALPKVGFIPKGWNVREWGGRKWTKSKRDLDRVFERDGVYYGIEIKNTLSYIDRDELEEKIEMCKEFGLVPLFIMRASPKSYNELIIREGGFALVFGWQLYPHGYGELAKEVRTTLGIPVDSPSSIEIGTVQRLLKWHKKKVWRKLVRTV